MQSESQVDIETGEVGSQLMLGISVPRVAVQRRAAAEMTEREFNATAWCFGEGDRLTAVCRDGKIVCKMQTGWGAE
jgi:hypothetical protein